jgi:NitT/TauT family transport system substrate-binding protein
MRLLAVLRCVMIVVLGACTMNAAQGEVGQIRIGRATSIGYLPMMVMEERGLLEERARALGLDGLEVDYLALSGGAAMNDALLSGSLDVASGGVPPFLLLWAKTRGHLAVKALSPFNSMTVYLNTRNPAVAAIGDFSPTDRIAVLTAKSSLQAMLLQMAAAKAFGLEQYERLDDRTVSMPLADAATQLMSGAGGHITADFTVPPFSYAELATPGIHNVLTSNQILGGPATYTLAYTTSQFRKENPRICEAFVAALSDAIDFIRAHPSEARDIYRKLTKSRAPVETIDRLLSDPAITFEQTPQKFMAFADFMHKTGRMPVTPASWKELFFEGSVTQLPGS